MKTATGALELANHRPRWTRASFTRAEKKQLDRFRYQTFDMDPNEFGGAEAFDVVDGKRVVYQRWLWPFGSGVLFAAGTDDIVADIVENIYHPIAPDPALRRRLARAVADAKKTFKSKQLRIEFPESETPAQKPAPAAPASVAAQIAEWRAAAAKGNPPKDDPAFWLVVYDALGAPHRSRKDPFVFRPYPVLRAFELDATAREALELVVDLGLAQFDFPRLGLPEGKMGDDPGDLARFLGRAPLGPLDAPVMIDGKPHPAWAIVSDALYGQRSIEDAVAHLATLPDEQRSSLWQAIVDLDTGAHHLKDYFPTTQKEYSQGSPYDQPVAWQRRYVDLVTALDLALADGLERARAAAEKFAKRKWEKDQSLSSVVDAARDATAVLRALHAQMKARGSVLPETYDALVVNVVEATRAETFLSFLFVVLDDLPKERACAIARSRLAGIARYPSSSSAADAARVLENNPWMKDSPFQRKIFDAITKKKGAKAKPKRKRSR